MTKDEALARAKTSFENDWRNGQGWNQFTGEVRVIDMAAAIEHDERQTGKALPPDQRERASRFFRVVFVSALPQIDCGSVDVIYLVDRLTGVVTEEVYD